MFVFDRKELGIILLQECLSFLIGFTAQFERPGLIDLAQCLLGQSCFGLGCLFRGQGIAIELPGELPGMAFDPLYLFLMQLPVVGLGAECYGVADLGTPLTAGDRSSGDSDEGGDKALGRLIGAAAQRREELSGSRRGGAGGEAAAHEPAARPPVAAWKMTLKAPPSLKPGNPSPREAIIEALPTS